MNKFVRALIAAWGAKKIGGGCVTTIVAFIIIYYALGTCNSHPVQTQTPHKTSVNQSPVRINTKVYFLENKKESRG
jgi:hypothetical protein